MTVSHLYMASDHAGFSLKTFLSQTTFPFYTEDLGPFDNTTTDYPDYIVPVITAVLSTPNAKGLLICGSGIGMCIGANRHKGIRAMVGHSVEEIALGRAHNNVNLLCLAGRLIKPELALQLVQAFMTSPFEEGRHVKRLEKLDSL